MKGRPMPSSDAAARVSDERLETIRSLNRQNLQAKSVPLSADTIADLLGHIDAQAAEIERLKDALRDLD